MRTSVEIPDPLLNKVRALARKRKTTLRSLVLEGLRITLEKEGLRKAHYKLPDESFGKGGMVEGLAPTDWDAIRAAAYEGRGG